MKIKTSYFLILTIIFLFSISSLSAQIGYCLDFDGDNDYVDLGNVLDLGTSDFTLEFWMNVNTFAPIGNLRRYPIGKGTSILNFPSGAGYAINLDRANGVNQVRFIVNVQNIITAEGFETGVWYHIAGVREGSNLYLYVNGELAQSGQTDGIVNVNTNGRLGIGTIQRSNGNTPAVLGQLDEVRIWAYAKPQEKIQDQIYMELEDGQTDLLAYYNFNQGMPQDDNGSGCPNNNPCINILEDNSDNNFTGNVRNFSLSGNNSNWVYFSSPLASDVLKFSAKQVENTVSVNWTTTNEINCKGFEIQQTTDRNTWHTIGFVENIGQSNNLNQYNFIHKSPNLGINYYRLKIVDISNEFDLSEIVSIQVTTAPEVRIYPNPTNGILQIDGDNFEQSTVRIINNLGKITLETKVVNQSINLSQLPHGVYWIHIKNQKISTIKKIVKHTSIP